MPKTTQLHAYHAEHAKMTNFAGYEMPLWYTTTTDEHLAVRNSSGVFDVSHMGRFLTEGAGATDFLEGLVPTAVGPQPVGKAFYTLLLNAKGGIIDDLIIERLAADRYMIVVNAANAETDTRHMKNRLPEGLDIIDRTGDTTMIAVQGPKALSSLQPLTSLDLTQLKRFRCAETEVAGMNALVSRTGYTGEDGFEVIAYGASKEHPKGAMNIWERLVATSTPCGLGARDSLRLEAGLPLHGSDIDQETNPFQAGLGWVITSGKEGYVGSEAVTESIGQQPQVIRRGLVMDSGIPRHGFEVTEGSDRLGTVTSGTFSPILRRGVALCRLQSDRTEPGTKVSVIIRGSASRATIARPPFYDEQLYGWKRQQR
jgi:glycine cleavage system T protein (aminomethyltransferase)